MNKTNTATIHEITQRRTRRRTIQRHTHTTKSQKKTQKKKLDIRENHLFRLKEREKK